MCNNTHSLYSTDAHHNSDSRPRAPFTSNIITTARLTATLMSASNPPIHQFPLPSSLPPHTHRSSSTTLRRPTSFTHFSYDETRTLRHDDSSLRWYWPARIGADLSRGFEKFVKHDDSVDEHLDGLLSAILRWEMGEECEEAEEEEGEGEGEEGTRMEEGRGKRRRRRLESDLVTWRGMMTKIMCLPFDRRSSFEMNAIKFQNTVYIEENHAYKMSTRGSESHQQQLGSYWGYKFETVSTTPKWWADCTREEIENREDETVDNEAQFCLVVKTGFNKIRIVLGGEVDALWSGTPHSSDNPPIYVELKTSKTLTSPNDHTAFERKLLRIWAQSFLLNVPKVIVGFRDRQGYLESLEELETVAIPKKARTSGKGLWDGNVCVDFAAGLVEWLKGVIVEDGRVWRVRYHEERGCVEAFPVEEEEGRGGKGTGFLSREFVEWKTGVEI